jgi:GDP-L-fucose synthase
MELAKAKKILVTGGAGFLGKRVCEELIRQGARAESLLIPRSQTHDLRRREVCEELVAGTDLVIHLAAKVGGIGFNQKFPGELFYDNAIMGINLIEASKQAKVKKLVVAGTICAYPRHTSVPFREENLWNGFPEETNAPYGIAKKSLLVMLQAYRAQYGLNSIFLLPVNLYGPEDNFDLENSHVIPALIRKFVEAKRTKAPAVTMWGDGSPTREFFHVRDAARGIVAAAMLYDSGEPVNLGSSEEISILDLAKLLKEMTAFDGDLLWDKTKPNGQERRKLDVSRAERAFQFRSEISLRDGLRETIDWWMQQGKNERSL